MESTAERKPLVNWEWLKPRESAGLRIATGTGLCSKNNISITAKKYSSDWNIYWKHIKGDII